MTGPSGCVEQTVGDACEDDSGGLVSPAMSCGQELLPSDGWGSPGCREVLKGMQKVLGLVRSWPGCAIVETEVDAHEFKASGWH